MEAMIIVLVGLLVAAGVAVLGYFSLKNLLQAITLYYPMPLSKLKSRIDKVVAVHGEPELLGDGRTRLFKFPVLWYRKREQEWRSSGKHGRWVTIRTREQVFDFHLHFPRGGRILLFTKPTEVQGASEKVMKRGFFSRSRTVLEWLPVKRRLTVMGRLILSKSGATLVADRSTGMIFSTHPPKTAALVEFAKGAGMLLAGLAATLFVIYLFLEATG
jgi:hypothetical protein